MKKVIQKAQRADLAARHERLAPPDTVQQTSAVRHPIGGTRVRKAHIAEIATNQSYIKCSLLNESTGKVATEGDEFEITVYADICGGERLDRASVNLTIGQEIFVTQCIYDNEDTPELRWFFVAPFASTEIHIGENP